MSDPQKTGDDDAARLGRATGLSVHATVRRVVELDALRGIAALLVLAFHYLHEYPLRFDPSLSTNPVTAYGRFGVHLFFMISGFVIYMTVEKIDRPMAFVTGRFSRLYPAYWVAIIFTFALLAVSPLPGVRVTAPQALVNLTMFERFVQVPYVDGAYWSLTVELAFYLLVTGLLVVKRTRWLLGTLWAACGVYVVGRIAWYFHRDVAVLDLVFNHATLLRFANLFLAGILFYLLVIKKQRSVVLYAQLALVPVVELVVHGPASGAAISAAVVIMGGALVYRPGFLGARPLVFFGAISYSLYLVHQNAGYVVIRWLDGAGVSHWMSVVAATCLAITVATVLHRFIERPGQAALRRWFARRRSSAT